MKNLTRKGNEWNWQQYDNWKDRHDFKHINKNLINRKTKVFGIGSCFAENVVKYLSYNNIDAKFFPGNSRFYDILSVKQVFEHLFSSEVYNKDDMWITSENKWRNPFRHPGKKYETLEDLCKEDDFLNSLAKKQIIEADVIAITIGGAELWRHPETKRGFTTIPFPDVFNEQMPGVAEVYSLTYQEHINAIDYIIDTIRDICPSKKIIFTVSPHRMTFTVSNKDVVQATCQGKSTIRAAVGEITDKNKNNIYYFNSYEIVEYSEYPELFYDDDFRHVNGFAIEVVMSEFSNQFLSIDMQDQYEYKRVKEIYRNKKNHMDAERIVFRHREKTRIIDFLNRINKVIHLIMHRIFK